MENLKLLFGIVLGRRSGPGRLQYGSRTKPSNPNVDLPADKSTLMPDFGSHFGLKINNKRCPNGCRTNIENDTNMIQTDGIFILNLWEPIENTMQFRNWWSHVFCENEIITKWTIPNNRWKSITKQRKVDTWKNEAQMKQQTPTIVQNDSKMEPKSINYPLKLNPKIDVDKRTSKNRSLVVQKLKKTKSL